MKNLELYKEIDLIQKCIERREKSSFILRILSIVAFVSFILSLGNEIIRNDSEVIIFMLTPFIPLWFLDGLLLKSKKKYCEMYKWVLENRKKDNLEYQYDLNSSRFNKQVGGVLRNMFVLKLFLFYAFQIFQIFILSVSLDSMY
ncbi:hypothetical protein N9251_00185 [Gammaproteobacteria bacterium]|nr:hypothetical protein [Gammaproteobacteria bacterium]